MSTVSDLGKAFKRKYPGTYDDLTDAEAGRAVQRKYPGKYDDFVEEALEVRQSPTPVSKPSARLMNPVEAMSAPAADYERSQTESLLPQLWSHYHPRKGQLTSWWQRLKSASRGELLGKVNEEQLEVIKMGAILAEEVRKGQKSEVDFKMFLARNAEALNDLVHNSHLRALAMDRGVTLEDYRNISREEELARVRTDEEQRRSDTKVSEHERLTDINLKARWREINQDLDAADLVLMSEQQLLKKLTDNLTALYREQHQIKIGDDPPPVKKRILARYDKNIEYLESLIDAKQAGHFSSKDREEAGRFAEGAADG